ncbi:(2Fe-2S)-binding protein [Virgibacillus salexigens]|uniref:(2Fe-2S)-binding protein n=1 Tax=Virgibacillus TaxID=84406 RepID=UPI002100E9E3|nr:MULTISPECIES: (2Fe-2S)-binding protein [Virgibacillus]
MCRCEEVTYGEIITSIENGAGTMKAVKLATRAGMGICQGRTCRQIINDIVQQDHGEDGINVIEPSYSTIIRPVRLVDLARHQEDAK